MRTIGLALARHLIQLCGELRFEAVRRILELSLRSCNLGQRGVQPLGAKYQERQQKHEQYFGAETHGLPLFRAFTVSNVRCRADRLIFVSFYGRLEAPDTIPDSLA